MSGNTQKFRFYFWVLFSLWTFLIVASSFVQYTQYKNTVTEIATREANLAFYKDTLYRRWAAGHGGVYVPVTEDTRPNPYLSHVAKRDLITSEGQKLTLVNPAYMTRQVYELAGRKVVQGHLTSDKLLNPANKPDRWEKEALVAVLQGEESFSGVDYIDNKPYLRFMRPFITEESCLKCHAFQGYKAGDIRGGISVAVPLSDYYTVFNDKVVNAAVMHGLVWLVGTGFLFVSFMMMSRLMASEERLSEEKGVILRELNHRVKNNLQIILSILEIQKSKKDGDLDTVLTDIQGRILSMASMHNILMQDKDLVGVQADTYIQSLADYFSATYNSGTAHVDIAIDCDPLMLSGTQALSCGLIVNELMTNSFKYAFDENRQNARISVKLKKQGSNIKFSYEDNGKGFDYKEVIGKNDSLGFLLISSMAEKLGSEINISGDKGMRAEINFSDLKQN